MTIDINSIKKSISSLLGKFTIFHLQKLSSLGLKSAHRLPFSIKILLENVLRNFDGQHITFQEVDKIIKWAPKELEPSEIVFFPGRVILQDFTGVPCLVDLAAMRSSMKRLGGKYQKINPKVQCDLIIDHSLQVDDWGSKKAFDINIKKEFARNKERYEFLKWGQNVFENFHVVPPGTGIIHQINLEYFAQGVLTKKHGKETFAFPDSVVGTDSHTTMINSLGTLGWGVGGIEAEAVMLGEPINMLLPEVVGVRLTGKLNEGVTATDLVFFIVKMLREKGVVGKFVEYFGEGFSSLSLPDRAIISNMTPEYGATIGFMPVDDETLWYFRMTGRDPKLIDLIERYMKEQELFYSPEMDTPEFSNIFELDLTKVRPCIAGPKRPQDLVFLNDIKSTFLNSLTGSIKERGYAIEEKDIKKLATVKDGAQISHGSVIIASITSCTNTSNPSVLMAAGLLAKKAIEKGLRVPSFVKTSFVPGSQVAAEYLQSSGLLHPLEMLGFHIVGYGCATCIGNSGPLDESIANAVKSENLICASVLSGNRNFEGRIHPLTKANFLASPALVVAFALAGKVDIDFSNDPIGKGKSGQNIYLKDIWPTNQEVDTHCSKFVTSKSFNRCYKNIYSGNLNWDDIHASRNAIYPWDKSSTYIQEPPFFIDLKAEIEPINDIKKARVLVMLGDSITTDHISPAGSIPLESPAGKYLKDKGIDFNDFNTYGARRGNDQVMTRGTFANIRLRNRLTPDHEGWWTKYFPTNENMTIYEAAQQYKKKGTPLIVIAGKEYGTGSSRDWAAKGTSLLGVRVVIAESFERIHRSNLAGMGILPLQFMPKDNIDNLGLQGNEIFDFIGINDNLKPRANITVVATDQKGNQKEFSTICRLDSPVEIDYFRNDGILQTVLRKFLKE